MTQAEASIVHPLAVTVRMPGSRRYLDKKDIPSSRPLNVSGYILPSMSWRVMAIDWVYSHSSSGTGLIQMHFS